MTDQQPVKPRKRAAPKMHRVLLFLAAFILTILLVWLWSYLLADIGAVNFPDYESFEKKFVNAELVDQRTRLDAENTSVTQVIEDLRQNQQLLRDSTNNARETMNQLLENQRRLVEKNIALSEPEKDAVAQSQQLFLENQTKYQQLNQEIVAKTNQQRAIRSQIEQIMKQLEPMTEKAQTEYNKEVESARMRAAVIKLAILIPLMMVAMWLLLRHRQSLYGIMVYPFTISVFLKMVDVVHEYFPSRYFKYIALIALIIAVAWLIVYLVKLIARPKKDFLLKQYQEAYERRRCPNCSYPVRRGLWKELPMSGKRPPTIVAMPGGQAESREEPYSCPSCGEKLFEECTNCQHIRPSLLPYCDTCGTEKTVAGVEG